MTSVFGLFPGVGFGEPLDAFHRPSANLPLPAVIELLAVDGDFVLTTYAAYQEHRRSSDLDLYVGPAFRVFNDGPNSHCRIERTR